MKNKKKYVKPQVKDVKLVPEEAVLANCKYGTGTNMNAGKCRSALACGNNTLGS